MKIQVEGYPPFLADPKESLLEACERAGVPMEAACGGFAACNSCRVDVVIGLERLDPPSDEEAGFLDSQTQRLGCQIPARPGLHCRLDPGI